MTLEKFLSQTSSHEIWQSQKGHGSALCFDMGEKHVKKNQMEESMWKGVFVFGCILAIGRLN